MQNDNFRIPCHGSYIYDIRFVQKSDNTPEHLMTVRDVERELDNREPLDLIFPFVHRAYPEASMASLNYYGNKNYTAIGTRRYGQEVMVLYRHDFAWHIMTIKKSIFIQYQERNPYYATVNWNELPEY